MIAALARLLGTTEQNAIDAAKSERGYRAAVSRRSFMEAGAALASGRVWGFGSMLAPIGWVQLYKAPWADGKVGRFPIPGQAQQQAPIPVYKKLTEPRRMVQWNSPEELEALMQDPEVARAMKGDGE